MKTKVCTRCGKEKDVDQFYKVKYRGKDPKYSYSVCKTCTAIEQKRRYLEKVDPTSPLLAKIETLYDKHRAEGRSIPDTPRRSGGAIEEEVDKLLGDINT